MPSKRYLIANNTMDPNEGFGVVMTREQHALTRTFRNRGKNLPTSNSYRSEIAQDLQDCIRILKADGSWNSEVRRSIMSGLDNFRREFPHLFERITR